MKTQISCAILLCCSTPMYAADDQIIELDAGSDTIANGQALIATVNGISDASAAKPYVIQLGPGRFNISPAQLILKPFVSLVGQGVGITQVQLNSSSNAAAIIAPGNNQLRDLHVQNLGSGSSNAETVGVQTTPGSKSVRLERISVLADGNGSSVALAVSGDLFARDSNFVGQTGTKAFALFYSGSGVLDLNDSQFSAINSGAGGAIALGGSSTSNPNWQLRDVRVTASHPAQTGFWLSASLSAVPVFRGLEVMAGKRGSQASCLASIGVDASGMTNFIANGCPQ